MLRASAPRQLRWLLSTPQALAPPLQRMLPFALGLVLALVALAPALAQINFGENLTGGNGRTIPDGVNRFGEIEVTEVTSPIDGEVLFKIASPTVLDRRQVAEGQHPVEQRAREIQARVELAAVERQMDGDSLRVEKATLNNVMVITARDDKHSRPLVLASVTNADANYYGLPVEEVAETWRKGLEKEIRDFSYRLRPENLARSLWRFLRILLVMAVGTALILLIKNRIRRRQQVLQTRLDTCLESLRQSDATPAEEGSEGRNDNLNETTLKTVRLRRRLGLWGLWQWLFFWMLLVLLYGGTYLLLSQLPGQATLTRSLVDVPLKLLTVWFCATLAIRFSIRLLDRFEARWLDRQASRGGDGSQSKRLRLRFSTILDAGRGLLVVVISVAGLLSVLGVLGVPSSSILAISGLLGLAISFGAQNLVRDLVNGFLILAEDQFAIGDVINVGGYSGAVERLNLRVTQLRSADGEFITLPNSTISQVKNLTRNWSRVNVSVDVDVDSDPDLALAVTRRTGEQLQQDPDWGGLIVAPPAVLGIDAIGHGGMRVTTWIDTAPGQHWAVSREFRLRLLRDLHQAGIRLGSPRQTYLGQPPQLEASQDP